MITLFIVTLGTMLIVILGESHKVNFSAKSFLYKYFIIWVSTMFTLAVVSVLWFTTYTDKVYYVQTSNTKSHLKITARQYTTKLMNENSLTYNPPKQVIIKEIPKGVYRFETWDYNS